MSKYRSVLAAAAFVAGAYVPVIAQTLRVNAAEVTGDKVAYTNGNADVHALLGIGVKYTIKVDLTGSNLNSLTMTDATVPSGFTKSISGNTLTVEYEPTEVNTNGVKPNFTVSYSYVVVIPAVYEKDEEGNDTDIVITEEHEETRTGSVTQSSTQTFHTYSQPAQATFSSTEKQWRLASESTAVVYTAYPGAGGYANGWRYKWGSDAQTSNASKSLYPITSEKGRTITTTVQAINYAPDMKTVWSTASAEYKLYVYNNHGIRVSSAPKYDGAEGVFYMKSGEWVLSSPANYSGTVQYEWRTDRGKTGNAGSFNPYPNAVDGVINDALSCTVRSVDDEGFELPNSNVTVIDKLPFTIYAQAKADHSASDIATYDDRSVRMSVSAAGGYPDGWRYEWIDGETIVGTEAAMNLESLQPGSYTYQANVINEYKDNSSGKVQGWFTDTYTFRVIVKEAPNATLSVELLKENLKGEHVRLNDVVDPIDTKGSYDKEIHVSTPIYLIAGENMNVNSVGSEGGRWNVAGTYILDGEERSVGHNLYAPDVDRSTKCNYTVVATYTTDEIEEPTKYTYIFDNLTVMPQPKVLESGNVKEIYSGESKSFQAMGTGGDPALWKTTWTDQQGNEVAVEDMADESIGQGTRTYNAHVTFVSHGVVYIDTKKEYTLRVWKKPEFEVKNIYVKTSSQYQYADGFRFGPVPTDRAIINCYEGDEIELEIVGKNGYSANSDTWLYSVDGGESGTMTSNRSIVVKLPGTKANDGAMLTIPVKAKNIYNGDADGTLIQCDDIEYDIQLMVYSTPIVSGYNVESEFDGINSDAKNYKTIHVYAPDDDRDNKLTYTAITTGGNPNGWKYNWTVVDELTGKTVYTSDNATLSFSPKSVNNKQTVYDISLRVLNEVHNTVQDDEDRTMIYTCEYSNYVVRAYPKAQIPATFTIVDANQDRNLTTGNHCVREDNALEMWQEDFAGGWRPASGGTVMYDWEGYGVQQNKRRFYTNATLDKHSQTKSISQMTYSLTTHNVGPYNDNVWESRESESQTINVFARPSTPWRVWVKGTGASGTVIAEAEVSEQELVEYDYYLVFGYDTKNGSDWTEGRSIEIRPVVPGEGQSRYTTSFQPAETQNSNNRFWVYSVWKYVDDGAVITSGKRYTDGSMDYAWDGSDYSRSTRANRGAIDDDDATPIQTASADESTDAVVEGYYGIDGIKTSALKRGLNVVRMSNGDVRKIYVK